MGVPGRGCWGAGRFRAPRDAWHRIPCVHPSRALQLWFVWASAVRSQQKGFIRLPHPSPAKDQIGWKGGAGSAQRSSPGLPASLFLFLKVSGQEGCWTLTLCGGSLLAGRPGGCRISNSKQLYAHRSFVPPSLYFLLPLCHTLGMFPESKATSSPLQ